MMLKAKIKALFYETTGLALSFDGIMKGCELQEADVDRLISALSKLEQAGWLVKRKDYRWERVQA